MDIFALKEWFLEKGRDLPWRKERTPYRVWIAEVMLQQTQAAVVIPYYERWMEQFPTLEALAQAPLENVMKGWEGLGYYSRARHLHLAAQEIVSKHNGVFPDSREVLRKIKGLGPYTVGAVLSFAFQQRVPAIDGNVVRVLSRYFLIEEEIGTTKVQKKLYNLTEELLPQEEAWVVMEALIELGAQVCKKVPLCHLCPVKRSCLGFQKDRAATLPNKKRPLAITRLERDVVLVFSEKELLVRQINVGEVMGGLWEFPYFAKGSLGGIEEIKKELTALLGVAPTYCSPLETVTHQFTRFRVTLLPTLWKVKQKSPVKGYAWKGYEELLKLPFSSGHRRLLHQMVLLV